MDANIMAAASCLHRAVFNMQARINELHQAEYREKQQESQEEAQIAKDLHQDEFTIAMKAANKDKDEREATREAVKLVARDHSLRHHRDEVKNDLTQKLS